MIVFNVDKELAKLGFIKVEENSFIVQYERENEEFGYTQCLDLCHKKSGKHLIMSYVKKLNSDSFNNVVGLTSKEAQLAVIKMRRLGW